MHTKGIDINDKITQDKEGFRAVLLFHSKERKTLDVQTPIL